jgi:pantothenate kinase
MHAGIDCGSTLIKAFWRHGAVDRFVTIDGSVPGIINLAAMMNAEGVRRVRQTGTGANRLLLPNFDAVPAAAGIDDEIRLQADGVRWLMARNGSAPRRMLIASVGTGVSYTKVSGRKAKRSPLGSAHGGGTIMGLAGLVGVSDFAALVSAATKGVPPDMLVKDKLPETAGTPVGELIIAHFAKPGASLEDTCAGIFSFSAASVFKDLAVLRSFPFSPKDVVVIGTVGAAEPFRSHLLRFAPHLPKGTNVHFPAQGEYAAAIGAWLAAH